MEKSKLKFWRTIAPRWKLKLGWLNKLKNFGFFENDLMEIEKEDDEEMEIIKRAEKEWRASQVHYSDKELLEIFPEAKKIIPRKIKEEERKKQILLSISKSKFKILKKKAKNSDVYSFWREWIKTTDVKKIIKIQKRTFRMKESLAIHKKNSSKGISRIKKDNALSKSIETVATNYGIHLKKKGGKFVGLCPFHNDKNPSFYIYPATNSFYCFGCQNGGDIITFVQLLYGFDFVRSVKWLNEKF